MFHQVNVACNSDGDRNRMSGQNFMWNSIFLGWFQLLTIILVDWKLNIVAQAVGERLAVGHNELPEEGSEVNELVLIDLCLLQFIWNLHSYISEPDMSKVPKLTFPHVVQSCSKLPIWRENWFKN